MPREIEQAFRDLADEFTVRRGPAIFGTRSSTPARDMRPTAPPRVLEGPSKAPEGRPANNEDMSLVKPPSWAAGPPSGPPPAAAPVPVSPGPAPRPQLPQGPYPTPAPAPTPEEQAGLPPDTRARSDGLRGPSGKVQLNNEGRRRWSAAEAKQRQRYGWHPGMNDASRPQPKLTPGRPAYNPYTGQWVEAEG